MFIHILSIRPPCLEAKQVFDTHVSYRREGLTCVQILNHGHEFEAVYYVGLYAGFNGIWADSSLAFYDTGLMQFWLLVHYQTFGRFDTTIRAKKVVKRKKYHKSYADTTNTI